MTISNMGATANAADINLAVIYIRISSQEQCMDGRNLEAQKRLLLKYARTHQHHIVRVFKDIETIEQSGRAGFNNMIRFLQDHPGITNILVEGTDRIFRCLNDCFLISELGRQLHLVKEKKALTLAKRDVYFKGLSSLLMMEGLQQADVLQ